MKNEFHETPARELFEKLMVRLRLRARASSPNPSLEDALLALAEEIEAVLDAPKNTRGP
jgi:hypothetical protein